MIYYKKSKMLVLILILQAIVMVYSLSSVMAKFASGEALFSLKFFLFYGLEFFALAVYAVLWQQVIKKIDLSIAYANRAMNLFWAIIWSVVIFNEIVSIKNIIGVLIVFIGIVIVNSDANG